jgi:hypothetical protein
VRLKLQENGDIPSKKFKIIKHPFYLPLVIFGVEPLQLVAALMIPADTKILDLFKD